MATSELSTVHDNVFKALSDPTRRGVLEVLSRGEMAAGEIASLFPISGPSVSRHLAVLRSAGLVTERRDANRLIYSLEQDKLAAVLGAWLGAVCPTSPPRPATLERPAREVAPKSGHKKKGKSAAKRKRKVPPSEAGESSGSEVGAGLAADRAGTPYDPGEELG
ncbi:MAG: metalloregulator ArsR/SmtB family transcription factor [Actinobacteria bacterium]|jgi:DNA-binding transcriptional ArsR family regulator|nr:metalloregulator ArsR/SmtB family transcription factor [Actinomycetota bacterium]